MAGAFSTDSEDTAGRRFLDNESCPPHHWTIIDRLDDGYREERWTCQKCDDVKIVRTAAWATNGRRMANTSTWTPEDKILGGEEEELEAAS